MASQIERATGAARSPWLFVPPLYFLQGTAYFIVDTATTIFLPALGVPLSGVGHVSGYVTLPWTLKPLWSPAVDLVSTKRTWTLAMQTLLVAAIASLAFAATSSHLVLWTTVVCAWIAIASATHDIGADGFYLLALDPRGQAAFVGIRNAAFRLGRVFVAGAIVYLAGEIEERSGDRARAWAIAFGAAAAVYGLGVVWCAITMPRPAADLPSRARDPLTKIPFVEALASYFRRPNLAALLAFILLYRFGELMLTTMSGAFLQAKHVDGGMELTLREIGLYSGTVGVVALTVGGIFGGWVISRLGLKRCLWPMAISMHVPNVFYAWAAFVHPPKLAIAGVIAVEQLGYGFGFAAFMVVLMRVSQGRGFSTTHYAISTGIMGLSVTAAKFVSGDLAAALGFDWFFVAVCACAVPSLLPLLFLRLEDEPAT